MKPDEAGPEPGKMTEPDRTRSGGTQTSKVGSFRIGSALLLIALVAVVLGVMRASLPLGILLAVSVIPAAIRTGLESSRRRAEGRRMGFDNGVLVFILAFADSFVVLIASSIAFCGTCVPISLLGMHGEFQVDNKIMIIAVTVGGLAALLVGTLVAFRLHKRERARLARGREGDEP